MNVNHIHSDIFPIGQQVTREIPGRSTRLGLMEVPSFIRDPLAYAKSRYKKYGPVSRGRIGIFDLVHVMGPDALETVYMNREKAFTTENAWDQTMGAIFTGGLLLRDGDVHKYHRRVMAAAFTSEALHSYIKMMNPEIDPLINRWVAGRNSAEVRMYPTMKKLTLDLAAKVFLGEKLGPEADRLNKAFVDTLAAAGPLGALFQYPIPYTPYWRGLQGRKVLKRYFYANLEEKRRTLTDDFYSQFCHATMKDGNGLTDKEIVDHMIFLLFAAHDTTNIAMNMMIAHLASNPKWQQRCREEVQALGRSCAEFDDELPILERVMNESLRLVHPVPGGMRRTVKETVVEGVRIPKGSLCFVWPSFSHYIDTVWTDPDTYDPDRFSAERAEDKKHKFGFAPFGGGIHKCLGMNFAKLEIKAVMTQLLQRYRWRPSRGYEMKVTYYNGLPQPSGGLKIHLERI